MISVLTILTADVAMLLWDLLTCCPLLATIVSYGFAISSVVSHSGISAALRNY